MKELILTTIKDMVSNLLYYDRKDDGELPPGSIEKEVEDGEITIGEMIAAFADALIEGLGEE